MSRHNQDMNCSVSFFSVCQTCNWMSWVLSRWF